MYLCKTELFEKELFICIKMDLALNNLEMLIWHPPPASKQTLKRRNYEKENKPWLILKCHQQNVFTNHIQCNPNIRELSGPDNKSLISGFGLFCLGNTGSNLGPGEILLYQGLCILIQCNPDIRDPDIRENVSGPKLESVLPKQNWPKPNIRETLK